MKEGPRRRNTFFRYWNQLCILVPHSSGDIINVGREDKTDHSKLIQQKSELVTDLSRGEKKQSGGLVAASECRDPPSPPYAALHLG